MRSFIIGLPKWLGFVLAGLIGGAFFSLLAEPFVQREPELPPQEESADRRPVDLVFVLDTSGSMSSEISGVQRNMTEFLARLSERGLKGRYALVVFSDGAQVAKDFTESTDEMIRAISPLVAEGGRGGGDSSLAGLYVATQLSYEPSARKVLILITDEDHELPDPPVSSLGEVTTALKGKGLDQIHLVVSSGLNLSYGFLRQAAPGSYFSLSSSGRSSSGLDALFSNVAQAVANPSMLRGGGGGIPAAFSWFIALQVAVWGGLACLGIGLLISVVQQYGLGSTLLWGELAKVSGVGAALGFVSGLIAQSLFSLAANAQLGLGEIPRLFSWCLMGAGMGLSLALVVPNLPKLRSLGYGAAAGFASCTLFLVFSAFGSDPVARFLGAGGLGVGIALAVTLAEALARRAHLVIHWAPNESTTVNLGPRPIEVGTSREATVRLPVSTGYPARVASFSLEQGKAVMVNHMTNTKHALRDGNKLPLGRIIIEIKVTLLGSPGEDR
jgi:hypothetical protein